MDNTEEFKAGDRVEAIDDFEGGYLKGKKGTVIYGPYGGGFLVEFDEYIGGHDGYAEFDKIMCKDGHGWVFPPGHLKKINTRSDQENVEKYGEKDKDEIAWSYSRDKKRGDTACGLLVRKYINRYCGDGEKSENPKDLEKAIDVIQRMKYQS